MNLIEKAVRNGYRFPTNRGPVTVEDLFKMSLTSRDGFNLDDVAQTVSKEISALETTPTSFVKRTTTAASKKLDEAKDRLEILKNIIKEKLDEEELRKEAAMKNAQSVVRRNLLAAEIERRSADSVTKLTDEELAAEIAAVTKG